MFEFFKDLLGKPPEIKKMESDIDQIKNELSKLSINLSGNTAFEKVSEEVIKLISENPFQVVIIMREFTVTIYGSTLILLLKVSGYLVTSGKYHRHKGILDNVGRDLMNIWDYAALELYQLNVLSREHITEARTAIEDEISAID